MTGQCFASRGPDVLMNLKTAIKLRGLTQWELCVRVGGELSPSRLSDLIAGRRQTDHSLRKRLAEILNADPDWLFESFGQIPLPSESVDRKQSLMQAAGIEGESKEAVAV